MGTETGTEMEGQGCRNRTPFTPALKLASNRFWPNHVAIWLTESSFHNTAALNQFKTASVNGASDRDRGTQKMTEM